MTKKGHPHQDDQELLSAQTEMMDCLHLMGKEILNVGSGSKNILGKDNKGTHVFMST